jgi:hypothetical protein
MGPTSKWVSVSFKEISHHRWLTSGILNMLLASNGILRILVHPLFLVLWLGLVNLSCIKGIGKKGKGYSESELRSIKGIQVNNVNGVTTFRIPYAQLTSADKRLLFEQVVSNYTDSMRDLKDEFQKNKMEAKGIEKMGVISNYHEKIRELTNQVVTDLLANKKFSDQMKEKSKEAELNGIVYNNIERQNMADTYYVPQLLLFFVGASTSYSVKGVQFPVDLGLIFAFQAYLEVIIDNETKSELQSQNGDTQRKKVVEMAIYLVPGVGLGMGVGSGQSLNFGVGVGFGPVENVFNLKKYVGTRVTAEINLPMLNNIPVVKNLANLNVQAFLMGRKKYPPVFLFLFNKGKSIGNKAGASIAPAWMMDPYSYISWISGKLGMDVLNDKDLFSEKMNQFEANKESGLSANPGSGDDSQGSIIVSNNPDRDLSEVLKDISPHTN